MTKLIITRGLPASGKSTRAREWVDADPRNRAQVNRDELRRMMHNGVHLLPLDGADSTEKSVAQARDALITAQLRLGKDAVCSDTNLPTRVVRHLIGLALEAGAEFEVWDLTDVPLEECLYRNSLREGPAYVPPEKIGEMYARFVAGKGYPLPMPEQELVLKLKPYVPILGVPNAVIVDVDGTVALMGSRDPYDESKVSEDSPNLPVIWAVRAMAAAGHRIVFCSGRTKGCYNETADWLNQHVDVPFDDLLMREIGDSRRDAVIKLELFNDFIRSNFNVVGVFDDRNQVVAMWRQLGLTVFQVADGDF